MITFTSLTIGQASGLIALGAAIITFTTPLLLGITLLRNYDATLSAATWSVIARQLQSSAWPSFLRTDSVAVKNVAKSVSLVAYLNIGLAFLTVLAGVITPLGLGDTIAAAGVQTVGFVYVPDSSSFGRSKQDRPDLPLSRDCSAPYHLCPGVVPPGVVLDELGQVNLSANPNLTSTTRIPENIITMFSSATKNSTIAGIFDIQYRFWKRTTNKYFGNFEPYVKGIYRPVENLLSLESLTLREGIIADMDNGGIGFRNHTRPSGLALGGEWDEDILWIEPDISCGNTNLSFEMTLGEGSSGRPSSVVKFDLVDDGGFSLLRTGDPYESWPNLTYSNPDVRLRADRSAWLYDVLAASVLNLTDVVTIRQGLTIPNVTLGRHYPLIHNSSFTYGLFPPGLRSGNLNPTWLELPQALMQPNGSLMVGYYDIVSRPEDYLYEWASALFRDLNARCDGRSNGVAMYIDHNVECGALLTMPERIDGGSPLEEENGSRWKISLYVCAGAIKSSVKTISISTNGSASLENLVVTKVTGKHYANASSYPLWAVEDWWYPGNEGADTAPLWGIVDDSYEGIKGYNFTRAPTFYLPYTNWVTVWDSVDGPRDSLAGTVAPFGILGQIMNSIFDSTLDTPRPRYDGTDSLALRTKWTSLSKSSGGSERLLRLIWTDMMASTTVGTTTMGDLFSPGGSDGIANRSRLVTVYTRRITYYMRYAIPALLLLTLWIPVLLAALMIGVSHRDLFTHLKHLLNDTSTGRVAASTAYPTSRPYLRSSTNEWVTAVGHVMLQLGGYRSSVSNIDGYEGYAGRDVGGLPDIRRGEQAFREPLL